MIRKREGLSFLKTERSGLKNKAIIQILRYLGNSCVARRGIGDP